MLHASIGMKTICFEKSWQTPYQETSYFRNQNLWKNLFWNQRKV